MTSPYLARPLDKPVEDVIFKLHHEAVRRRGDGQNIIDGTLGVLLDDEHRLAVLPSAVRAVRDVRAEDWASYAPITGDAGFLEAVTAHVFEGEAEAIPQTVGTATPGGTGALRLALTVFLRHGDAMLTSSFFWGPYATLCEEHDRKLVTFEMFAADGSLDIANFEKLLVDTMKKQGRALVVLNDPCHNPTGYSMSDADWTQVTDVVLKHSGMGPIAVLLDSAYAAFAAEGTPRGQKHLLRLAGKALPLVAWSASKAFTHYGLRVGALLAVSPDANERALFKSAFNKACRGTWSNCNHGGMVAIGALLANPQLNQAVNHERESLKSLLGGRVEAFNKLARPAGLRYPRYEGGFFVSVLHPNPASAAEKLRNEGIYLVPQPTSLRVALCSVPTSDVPRLVQGLSRVV